MKAQALKWVMAGAILSVMGIVHAQSNVEHPEAIPAADVGARALMMKPEGFPKTQTTAQKKTQEHSRITSQSHRARAPQKVKKHTRATTHSRVHRSSSHAPSTMMAPCAPVKPVEAEVCSMPK